MEQQYTNFQYQARFFQIGKINTKTKHLIFVIHGYGQQAKYFIDKFKVLDNGNNCIVAPEGLSRFYMKGFNGRVGATWMTKEDRLTDIKNYINYLYSVYQLVVTNKTIDHIKISVIGFSQGAATASRWVANIEENINQLILWAGIFPPDLNYSLAKEKFKSIDIKYVYGLNDPFLNKNRIQEMEKISKSLDVKPKTITFDGEHVIDSKTLESLFL